MVHARRRWLVGGIAICMSGCAQADRVRLARCPVDAARQIRSVLAAQVDAWNRGDVDAFMAGYWKSPELAFVSGGRKTLGWQATLDGYRQRYPTRDAMGELSFSELHVRTLAHDAAVVSGRWRLTREAPIGGRFTLLFRRIDARWVIVYDHTSAGDAASARNLHVTLVQRSMLVGAGATDGYHLMTSCYYSITSCACRSRQSGLNCARMALS